MDFDKPKGVENNDIFNIQEIKNKNSENAKRFAEDNSSIFDLLSEDFKEVQDALKPISDANGTLAAQKRGEYFTIKTWVKTGKNKIRENRTETREVENPNETTNPGDVGGDNIGGGPNFGSNTTPGNNTYIPHTETITETIPNDPYTITVQDTENNITKLKIEVHRRNESIEESTFFDKINSMNTQELVDLVNSLQEILENSENSEKITELDKYSNIRKIKNQIEDIEQLLEGKNKKSYKEKIDNFPSQNEKGDYDAI